MSSARWWSESKAKWQPIESLPDGHLHNCLRKLERGEYRLPGGSVLGFDEAAALEKALREEIGRREDAKFLNDAERNECPDAIPDDEVDMSGGAS